MYQRPTPVAPANLDLVLDAAQGGDLADALTNAGAQNAKPPLPHSAYLKNLKTGLVFPYMERMAQMSDIMANCDINGNTDPAAWQSSVVEDADYDPQEEAIKLQSAVLAMDTRLKQSQQEAPVLNDPAIRKLPYDAEFFDRQTMNQESERLLDQLSGLM